MLFCGEDDFLVVSDGPVECVNRSVESNPIPVSNGTEEGLTREEYTYMGVYLTIVGK